MIVVRLLFLMAFPVSLISSWVTFELTHNLKIACAVETALTTIMLGAVKIILEKFYPDEFAEIMGISKNSQERKKK